MLDTMVGTHLLFIYLPRRVSMRRNQSSKLNKAQSYTAGTQELGLRPGQSGSRSQALHLCPRTTLCRGTHIRHPGSSVLLDPSTAREPCQEGLPSHLREQQPEGQRVHGAAAPTPCSQASCFLGYQDVRAEPQIKIKSTWEDKMFLSCSIFKSLSLSKGVTCQGQSPELLSKGLERCRGTLAQHPGILEPGGTLVLISPTWRRGGPEMEGTVHHHTAHKGPRCALNSGLQTPGTVLFIPLQHFSECGMQTSGVWERF